MAETLGSLCDKLTIVKLKQWHSDEPSKLDSLSHQERQLEQEIDDYLSAALTGEVPLDRLTFAANKVYKSQGDQVALTTNTLGQLLARLAEVNIELWHEQEKVYEFEKVPPDRKDFVVKRLAVLNLERNQCIDGIDGLLRDGIASRLSRSCAP